MSETTLPTLIAELEEALKAATAGPWESNDYGAVGKAGGRYGPGYPPRPDSIMHGNDGEYIENPKAKEDARLIALMRNSLPTLIEALKRQEEALAPFAKAGQWYTPKEAEYEIGGMIKVADLFAARAALKETTDED